MGTFPQIFQRNHLQERFWNVTSENRINKNMKMHAEPSQISKTKQKATYQMSD